MVFNVTLTDVCIINSHNNTVLVLYVRHYILDLV